MLPRYWLVAVLSLQIAGSCGRGQDGPTPAPNQGSAAIDPDAVCAAQAPRVITLFGEGMSPLPTKVLEDNPELILPQVELQQTVSIDGQTSAADAFVVPDDAGNPGESRVRWIDQGELRFSLESTMNLSPGLYSIRVTNGNDNTTLWEDALLIVPPPQVTTISPEAICEAKDTEVELSGDFFVRKGESTPTVTVRDSEGDVLELEATRMDECRALPGQGGYEACKKMVVIVAKGALAPGTYTVVLQNPDPIGCASETTISLEVVALPTITAVEPTKVCSGGGTLSITGTNFHPAATVSLGGVAATSVTVESETKITASFGGELPTEQGALDVTVSNPGGCDVTKEAAVQVVEGPQLFFADPPVVYNGISTQVTLFGSGISAVESVGIRPAGSNDAPTILTHTFDVLKPSRVQVVIPASTAKGSYDVVLVDSTVPDCEALLAGGLTVVDQITLKLEDLDPPFGHTSAATSVTVFADATTAGGFQPLPRLYLNPTAGVGNAAPLQSITFVDSSRATAVVPAGLPVGSYDLIAVNPDGGVGLLSAAFEVTAEAPPLVDGITPGSIPNRDGESVTVSGANFRDPVVTLSCLDGTTGAVLPDITPTLAVPATADEIRLTIDAGGLGAAVCILRVENSDGTYGDYSALVVTNPAQNLGLFSDGPAMQMARRGLGGAAASATRAARFVYAVAGDDGAGGIHDTVEVAPVDVYGRPGSYFVQQQRLMTPRTRIGAAVLGRCIYVAGGANANGPLATAERACVLDPEERPEIVDLTLRKVDADGLGVGVWYYRVSALLPSTHAHNPGGETLTSEPFPLLLPDLGDDLLEVTLSWATVPGATAYRIYRSPVADAAADGLELLVEVAGSESSYVDVGGATDSSRVPLRFGATGVWHGVGTMQDTNSADVAREAPGVAIAPDPATPGSYNLYVLGGKSDATTALASYHRLPITVEADGSQTVGSFVLGNAALATARHQLAAYSVGNSEASFVAATRHLIYAGSGIAGDDTTKVSDVDAFEVESGGELLRSTESIAAMSPARAGYGYAAANNFLFAFGGQQAGPSTGATAAQICETGGGGQCAVGPPRLVNWNTATSLSVARYLMGSAVQSGFIYMLGGQTGVDPATTTTTSTEYVIW